MEPEFADPQLLLSLRPTNSAAYQTFEHIYNRGRYDPGTFHLDNREEEHRSSRESTPARTVRPREPSIHLRFDQPPKSRSDGYVFGSDPESCDVFLGRAIDGISAHTFSIRFTKDGRLYMLSKTKNDVSITYDDDDGPITRSDFIWMLFSWKTVIKVCVASFLTFDFVLPSHGDRRGDYRDWRGRFLKGIPDEALSLEKLATYNLTQACYRPKNQTPYVRRQGAAYARYRELGRGLSSLVDRVCNVSSSEQYVRKKYTQVTDSVYFSEKMDILMSLRHDNLASLKDFTYEHGVPHVIMEYFPLGNLEHQDRMIPLSDIETAQLLFQGLEALKYLQDLPDGRMVHGNIKPANILFDKRELGSIHVRLADFGSASQEYSNVPLHNNHVFRAPEYFDRDSTGAGDIWSLGVVIASCLWSLPLDNAAFMSNVDWCKTVVREVEHEAKENRNRLSELLITALQSGMVQMQPADRFSADYLLTSTLHQIRVELHLRINHTEDDAEGSTDSEYARTEAEQAGGETNLEGQIDTGEEASRGPSNEPRHIVSRGDFREPQDRPINQQSGSSHLQQTSQDIGILTDTAAPGQRVLGPRGAESSQMGAQRYDMRTRKRSAGEITSVEGPKMEDELEEEDNVKIRGHRRRRSSKYM